MVAMKLFKGCQVGMATIWFYFDVIYIVSQQCRTFDSQHVNSFVEWYQNKRFAPKSFLLTPLQISFWSVKYTPTLWSG